MGHRKGREETKPIFTSRALAPVVLMGGTPMLRNAWRLPGCAGMTLPPIRLLRQTNPICGQAEGRTSAVWIRSCDEWDAGEALEKQSQFPRHGRDARGTHGQSLPLRRGSGRALSEAEGMPMLRNAWRCLPGCAGTTLLRTRLLRQTNPISGRLKRRLTAAGEKSYDEFCLPKASEKQSQFPRAEPAPAQAGDARDTHGRNAHATNTPVFPPGLIRAHGVRRTGSGARSA